MVVPYVLLLLSMQNVQAQETTSHFQQHEARRNRVWSLRITFEVCGIDIDNAQILKVGSVEGSKGWRRVNPDLVIVQWSQDIPQKVGNNSHYGLYDLLGDYSHTRYIIRIEGHGKIGKFLKVFWVSPGGLSDLDIPPAPLREDRSSSWTIEDSATLAEWFEVHHKWSNEKFFREFSKLLHMSDKRLDIAIKLKTRECVDD